MAKKAATKPIVAVLRRKASSLVDTRVIYCGENLKQPGRMRFPILHSSFFILNLPARASYYVKVIRDQIFGENNLTN